jgi:nitroreductase
MELRDLLQRRRMTRSFDGTPVGGELLSELCEAALRSPTAGNSAGVRFSIATGDMVDEYFTAATDAAWRAQSSRFPGLARAGAVVVVTSRPQDYLARYGEADKAASGLSDIGAWPVPYWHTDAAMATMSLLLLLEEAELGACLWGNFRRDDEVLSWLGANDESLFASILVGRADGGDHRSRSLDRPVPPRSARVRRL